MFIKREDNLSKSLCVNSIFQTLQGEGVYSLRPTTFIRFQGCKMNCKWCDTTYSKSPIEPNYTIKQVLDSIDCFHNTFICITGGEPFDQAYELKLLVQELVVDVPQLDTILIETNGCLYASDVRYKSCLSSILSNYKVCLSVDIKGPSSGMSNFYGVEFFHFWSNYLSRLDTIKYVIDFDSQEDIKFLKAMLLLTDKFFEEKPHLYVSPVMYERSINGLEKAIDFCTENNVNLNIQLHKLLGIS